MDDSKLSVNQIIEAIKMLTTSEYNEFVSKLASLQRPEDSIDAYIEERGDEERGDGYLFHE